MKKKFICIAIFIILSILFFIPEGNTVFAESEEEVTADIEEEVEKRLNELDLNEFESFFQELEDENLKSIGTSLRQIIRDIIDGKRQIGFETLVEIMFTIFIKEFIKVLPMVITIIIIAILYGIFSGLSSGFSKSSTKQIIYIVCYGSIITLLGYSIASAVVSVKSTVNLIDKMMGYSFPILLTLTSALGGVGSASIYQPVMTIMTTVMIKILNAFIFPLFIASVVFGIVGNISDNVKLNKLTKTTKSIAEWTLGIVFGLFISYITVQGITGTAFDTITIKSAKFALSSYVPILGGYLSEGFDLVMASCVVIKNAVGLCSIIILFFLIAAPLMKLLVLIFCLRVAASIIEPVSDQKMADLLYDTSKNLITLVAIILGMAFLFFILIMLIIATCNFGVI